MDIYQFTTSVTKDKRLPIYVFYGDEEFFIHIALTAIKNALLKDTDRALSLFEYEEMIRTAV